MRTAPLPTRTARPRQLQRACRWFSVSALAASALAAAAADPPVRCSLVGASALRFDGVTRFNATLVPTSPVCLGLGASAALGLGACFNRTFTVTLPSAAYYSAALPLAFALHGGEEGAAGFLDGADGGAPGELPIDQQLAAIGFITVGPNALSNPVASALLSYVGQCDAPCSLPFWSSTTTLLDPIQPIADATEYADEVSFLWDAAQCLRDTLVATVGASSTPHGLNLSGRVFAFGHSQGAKLSTFFGCSAPRAGFSVDGVVASAGIKVDLAAAPRCLDPSIKPPPLIAFQAQQDETVPFCTPYLYAAGSVYWSAWSTMAGCSPALLVPSSAAICPAGGAGVSSNTTLLRAYVGDCESPTALLWTSEANPSFGYHRWPSPLAALGGFDGTAVAAALFTNVIASGTSRPSAAQAFAGLFDSLSAAACAGQHLSALPLGPCGSDPDVLSVLAADAGTLASALALNKVPAIYHLKATGY